MAQITNKELHTAIIGLKKEVADGFERTNGSVRHHEDRVRSLEDWQIQMNTIRDASVARTSLWAAIVLLVGIIGFLIRAVL